MTIAMKFGPFRLAGGQHVEDEPLGITAKVKQPVKDGALVLEVDGKEVKCQADSNAALVDFRGQTVSLHRQRSGGSWQRMSAAQLTAGDEVELCQEVTYGPPDAEPGHKLRFPTVRYAPFYSKDDLSKLNRPPVGMKFLVDHDAANAGELQALRDQVEAQRRRIAELEASKGPPDKPESGKLEADKSSADAGRADKQPDRGQQRRAG